jgi:hypothetical protein
MERRRPRGGVVIIALKGGSARHFGMRPSSRTKRAARGRRRLTRVAVLTAAFAAFAIPASAQAITVSGTAAPTNLQAGANSDFEIHIDFAGGQVQNLTVGLPPGMVGDPTATPKCSVAQLNADACDPETIVGEVDAAATVVLLPITASGFLYNLEAQAGEPARFGIVLHPLGLPDPVPPIILQSGAQLRQTDFGLNTVINGIPNTTLAMGDTTINSQDITLYGTAPGTGKPFMRNPTSCTPKTSSFSAVPYSGATGSFQTAPFVPTGCENLPFSPTFSARMGSPGQNAVLGKPPVSSVIEQDAGEAGLAEAKVLLPPDLGVDVAQLNEICALDAFNAAACPAHTVIGSAFATSPLLTQPLTGPVTLVQGAALPDIGLNLAGPLSLNLHGTLNIAGSVTFSGLPDIPISHFELNFVGGPDGLNVANRNLCLPPPPLFHENFTGHNGATTSLDTFATVEGGCGPVAKKKCKAKAKKKKGKKSEASAAKKKKQKKKSCKKKKKKRKKR